LSDHADGYDAAAFDGNISVKGPSEHVWSLFFLMLFHYCWMCKWLGLKGEEKLYKTLKESYQWRYYW
jgi:hypothetical protein